MRGMLLAIVAAFIPAVTLAETKTWDGSADRWIEAGLWAPVGVPTADDDVIVSAGQAVVIGGSGTCASFAVQGTGYLIVNDVNDTLQVVGNGTVTGSSAWLRVNMGHLDMGGSVTLVSGGGLVLDALSAKMTVQSLDPRDGTFTWNAGTLRFTTGLTINSGESFSSLTVATGRTLEVISPTDVGIELRVGDAGTLTLAGGQITCDAFTKTTDGTVVFGDGTLKVNGDGFEWGATALNLEGTTSSERPTLVLNEFWNPSPATLAAGVAVAPSDNRQGNLVLSNGSVLNASGSLAEGAGSDATAHLTGAASWDGDTLIVGGAGTGTLTIEDSSSGWMSAKITVGRDSTATGTVTVDGDGSSWGGYWEAQIGVHGAATLEITNGATVSFEDQIGNTEFARYSGSSADVTVSGSSSKLQIKPDAYNHVIYFGHSGQASLTVSDGASVVFDEFTTVGETASGQGDIVVTGAGSTWTVTDDLWLGYEGTGTLQVLSGGVVRTDAGKLGEFPNGTGEVTVSGTGSVWHGGGAASIGGEFLVGRYGTGELTVQNGGVVYSSGYSVVGQYSDSVGTVTVTGVGSLWDVTGELFVSDNYFSDVTGEVTAASGGLVTVSGTAYLASGGTVVLNGGAAGAGTFAVNHLNLSKGGSITGDNAGLLRVNAVTARPTDWTVPASLQIGHTGGSSAAAWTVGSGESLTVAGGLTVGYDKNAAFALSGGTVGALDLYVGLNGQGTFEQTGGTATFTNAYVGRNAGSTGQLVVSGSSATFSAMILDVGVEGAGDLLVEAGGTISGSYGSVGGGSGGGVITGAGSAWDMAARFYVGTNGFGQLTISDGGFVRADIGHYLGAFDDDSTGRALVTGAGSVWTCPTLSIGATDASGTGTGQLWIDDGGLVQASAQMSIDLHSDQGSYVRLSDGGMLAVNGEGDADIAAFLAMINGTDNVQYFDGSSWTSIASGVSGVDYRLDYYDSGDFAGQTILTVNAVPEPATLSVLLLGAVSILKKRRPWKI